jgi:cytochrome P450
MFFSQRSVLNPWIVFAGHETTANTTHYALVRLALHSEFQDALLNEVDAVYERAACDGRTSLEYESDFASAQYAMALMVSFFQRLRDRLYSVLP